jgi:hypothetical protein
MFTAEQVSRIIKRGAHDLLEKTPAVAERAVCRVAWDDLACLQDPHRDAETS